MVTRAATNGMFSPPSAEQEALEVAARAITEALETAGMPSEITLSNGIVLRLKPIPREILRTVAEKYPEPVVPQVHIEDDDRWEDNPNDPDYLEALAKREDVLSRAMADVCLGLGTEVLTIPDGMVPPEDDGWIEDLQVVGVDVPTKPAKARYMAWLRFYALTTAEDGAKASGLTLLMSAIGQEEVLRAMRSFRGRAEREADPGLPAREESADRPDLQKPNPGRRPRDRRTRGR